MRKSCVVCAQYGSPKNCRKLSLKQHVCQDFNYSVHAAFIYTTKQNLTFYISGIDDVGTSYSDTGVAKNGTTPIGTTPLDTTWIHKNGTLSYLWACIELTKEPMKTLPTTRGIKNSKRSVRRQNETGKVRRKHWILKPLKKMANRHLRIQLWIVIAWSHVHLQLFLRI